MPEFIKLNDLQIKPILFNFIKDEVLPNLPLTDDDFWTKFSAALEILMPINKSLLEQRDILQQKQDDWHKNNVGPISNMPNYIKFLKDIGYIANEPSNFAIGTTGLDAEITTIAGAQLVVPINNARYALNAANARWGSLYHALYGTNVIADRSHISSKAYDTKHGEKVISWGRDFLDQHFTLKNASFSDATSFFIDNDKLSIILQNDDETSLINSEKLIGYQGDATSPTGIILKNNGLHIIIKIDKKSPIGSTDMAHIADIMLESALSTIMDCEDSVAAVNAAEKVAVYRNWLGLMKSDLSVQLNKSGTIIDRKLNPDINYTDISGQRAALKARALMLVRNVGHLMTSDAILFNGQKIPEGLMDAFITSLIALHNILPQNTGFKNSDHGAIYIVKPKMHGSDEVAFSDKIFSLVEASLGLDKNTIKIGIMDEERRTSVNLKACIHAVKDRVFFINTGFLDRTGDEIHSIMYAGPVVPKGEMKNASWIASYEARNVQIGLECGFKSRAQIGKGMWAMPDEMADMMVQKTAHLKAGATTAWVPSPTAATLHATHYHQYNLSDIQDNIIGNVPSLETLLDIPVIDKTTLDAGQIMRDLKMNCQSILGYVVRWIDQGIGCSKVPDMDDIGLMEDRATLRISSQHIANWLLHDICTKEQVTTILKQMAIKVDAQNAGDKTYQNMAPNYDQSIAFEASYALIFEGLTQPSGYTEPLLHGKRRQLLDH